MEKIIKIRVVETNAIEEWTVEKVFNKIDECGYTIETDNDAEDWEEWWDEFVEPLDAYSRRVKAFQVEASFTTTAYATVYALDEADAIEIGEGMDGGDFVTNELGGDYEITNVMEQ